MTAHPNRPAPRFTNRSVRAGWLASLAVCIALFAALTVNVHAVHSEERLADRQLISLQRELQVLETEFQSRASQRQLADWNAIELGYEAPRADQYLEGERQLASLGALPSPGAPVPIRVARADPADGSAEPRAMTSPVTGEPIALAAAQAEKPAPGTGFAAAFGDFVIDASPIRAVTPRGSLMDAGARERAE